MKEPVEADGPAPLSTRASAAQLLAMRAQFAKSQARHGETDANERRRRRADTCPTGTTERPRGYRRESEEFLRSGPELFPTEPRDRPEISGNLPDVTLAHELLD